MNLPRSPLLATLLLAVSACGDAEPEPEPSGQAAAPTLRPQDFYDELASEDTAQKRVAVMALGQMASEQPEAVDILINLLADQSAGLGAEARTALYRAGLAVLPDLIAALESPLPNVRSGALMVIARHGPAAADASDEVAALLETDPDWSVRFRAVEALAAMGPAAAGAARALEMALEDENASVRQAAGEALERVRAEAGES